MASSYLTRQTTAPTSEQKFTFSTWMKVSGRTGADNGIIEWYRDGNNKHQILIDSTSSKIRCYSTEGGTNKIDIHSTAYFKDPAAWYHIVIQSDNTQASASDRFKMWVNGVAATFSTYTWSFSQGVNINVFDGTSGDAVNVGTRNESTGNSFDGCLADTYYIDGYIIAYTEFGETDTTSGIWKPNMSPTISSYGNAGFHLTYQDSSNLGDDTSGNSKDMTSVGTITQNLDTPSNNYCVLNGVSNTSTGFTLANGNLSATFSSGNWETIQGTIGVNKGKWYYETKWNGSGAYMAGWTSVNFMNQSPTNYVGHGHSEPSYAIQASDGSIYYSTSSAVTQDDSGWEDTFTSSDIIGCAIDIDNGKLYWSKNGVWMNSGNPESGSTGTGAFNIADTATNYFWQPVMSSYNGAQGMFNFGSGYFGTTAITSAGSNGNGALFEYDVPSGYYALNTKNLKEYG
jgi:hypothetical protein